MNPLMPSQIALPTETRTGIVRVLDTVLANTMDLYSQVKYAHWNIKGTGFIARHELFDDIAEHLRVAADDVAERVSTLGGQPCGTVRTIASKTQLEEYPIGTVDGNAHMQALVGRLGAYCAGVREAIRFCRDANDPPTEDMLSSMLTTAEKDLWFLESHRNA